MKSQVLTCLLSYEIAAGTKHRTQGARALPHPVGWRRKVESRCHRYTMGQGSSKAMGQGLAKITCMEQCFFDKEHQQQLKDVAESLHSPVVIIQVQRESAQQQLVRVLEEEEEPVYVATMQRVLLADRPGARPFYEAHLLRCALEQLRMTPPPLEAVPAAGEENVRPTGEQSQSAAHTAAGDKFLSPKPQFGYSQTPSDREFGSGSSGGMFSNGLGGGSGGFRRALDPSFVSPNSVNFSLMG